MAHGAMDGADPRLLYTELRRGTPASADVLADPCLEAAPAKCWTVGSIANVRSAFLGLEFFL